MRSLCGRRARGGDVAGVRTKDGRAEHYTHHEACEDHPMLDVRRRLHTDCSRARPNISNRSYVVGMHAPTACMRLRHAPTACADGMRRRHAPTACADGMHAPTACMRRRHAPTACMRRRHAPTDLLELRRPHEDEDEHGALEERLHDADKQDRLVVEARLRSYQTKPQSPPTLRIGRSAERAPRRSRAQVCV